MRLAQRIGEVGISSRVEECGNAEVTSRRNRPIIRKQAIPDK
jgi:hypothetical protein